LRSLDKGGSWTLVYDSQARSSFRVPCFAFHESTDVFAGTLYYSGNVEYHGAVLRSTDNGETWASPSLLNPIGDLAINSNGHIFAVTTGRLGETGGGSIYRSTDNGISWIRLLFGFPGSNVSAIDINPNGHIFAGTGTGIFRSMDNGETWDDLGGDARDFAINNKGRIFALGYGGVYRSIEPSPPIEPPEEIPLSFTIRQNYPNPFNAGTTIEFTLFGTGFVTLKVYNITGKEVATLVEDRLPEGPHQVLWNPDGLASGVYLYRLKGGEYTQTRKLLLLK